MVLCLLHVCVYMPCAPAYISMHACMLAYMSVHTCKYAQAPVHTHACQPTHLRFPASWAGSLHLRFSPLFLFSAPLLSPPLCIGSLFTLNIVLPYKEDPLCLDWARSSDSLTHRGSGFAISASMLLLKSKKLKHHKGLQWQLPPPPLRAHAWVSQKDSFEGDPAQKPLKSPNMFRVAAFTLLRKCFKNVDLIPACMSIHVCIDAYTREHGGQRAKVRGHYSCSACF